MNLRALFVVGLIAGVVALGLVVSSLGGGDGHQTPFVYRGLDATPTPVDTATTASPGSTPGSTPGAPSTARTAGEGPTPAGAGGPATPVGTGGHALRPGDTRGATDAEAAAGATPLARGPGQVGAGAEQYRVPGGGQSIYDAARAMLGDAERWPEVYRANRSAIADLDRIPAGTVLVYPETSGDRSGLDLPKLGGGIR